MSNFDHDDLPPDLSDLGRRMRDERPVAEDDALDRMMQRARTPRRQTPRRAPRRALATSLATMLAMVSVTGVAAAALFGNFGFLSNAFTNSNRTIGSASSQALRAPAASTNSRPANTLGSGLGNIGGLIGARPPRGGAATPAVAAGLSATRHDDDDDDDDRLFPGIPNAGNQQYGARRLVCRILRALGLRFVARLLGC